MEDLSRPLHLIPTSQLQLIATEIKLELKKRRKQERSFSRVDFRYNPKRKVSKTIKGIQGVNKMCHKMAYLENLLEQDWDFLFDGYDNSDKRFYVYFHKDPKKSMPHNKFLPKMQGYIPFYVGKGTGNRYLDINRNQGHGKKIKELLTEGYKPEDICAKIAVNLGEKDALVLESKLIYLFGTLYEGRCGILVNLDTGKRPIFKKYMKLEPLNKTIIRRPKINKEKNEDHNVE